MTAGFDTSNYTTSAAILTEDGIVQKKKMLTVRSGERGLRQSDAVFQHTVNMPELLEELEFANLAAVGVSDRPRNVSGSYMPCFTVGVGIATAVAKAAGAELYKTSHQVGHILAALYSANKLELVNREFLAFHLSGGTTEALLVKPHRDEVIRAELIAGSLDLKAGQAIDRAGVMMGYSFPCGKKLDELAADCTENYRIKPSMKGADCSLSGVENKAKQMLDRGEPHKNIAKFVLQYVCSTVDAMLGRIIQEYGDLPVIFSGGVSSNKMLKQQITQKYGAYFAAPEFSLDNAAGTALFASIKHN